MAKKNKKKISDSRIDETIQVLEDILLENEVSDNVIKYVSDMRDKLIAANINVNRCKVKHFLSGNEKRKLMEELSGLAKQLDIKMPTWAKNTCTVTNMIGHVRLSKIDVNRLKRISTKFLLKEGSEDFDGKFFYSVYLTKE